MLAGLAVGDDHEQVGRAWIAAQELLLLYREPRRAAGALQSPADAAVPLSEVLRNRQIWLVAMGVFFLIGALHNPKMTGRRVYALLVLLGACAGIGIAAYHVWVQHQPPNPLAGCTPGWNYWVENFSVSYAWSKTIQAAFTGHADCAEINWTFLGLSMPFWTLLSFLVLGAGAIWAGFRKR